MTGQDKTWMTAKEALDHAAGRLGDDAGRGMTAIKDKARLGLVRAKAAKLTDGGIQTAEALLEPHFWAAPRGLLGGASAVPSERWVAGDFQGCSEGFRPCNAEGVQFMRADIERLFPAGPRTSRSRSGGRSPGKWWPAFSAELVLYIHDNGVPPGTGTDGIEKVIADILSNLAAQGLEDLPARSSIQGVIADVLQRLRNN